MDVAACDSLLLPNTSPPSHNPSTPSPCSRILTGHFVNATSCCTALRSAISKGGKGEQKAAHVPPPHLLGDTTAAADQPAGAGRRRRRQRRQAPGSALGQHLAPPSPPPSPSSLRGPVRRTTHARTDIRCPHTDNRQALLWDGDRRNSITRIYRQAADGHSIRGARAENSNRGPPSCPHLAKRRR
ncbi:hypothetical protein LZ30DRAFT_15992 [Colletotrichum cereale]|nr:hypothetical protein LZ30DRAFT_15992 [Colletotrichum cereale]